MSGDRRENFWVNGLPTDHCIEVFTQGDCWALAHEITTMTPLRMYLIGGGAHWIAGDGRLFLDITGVSTRSKLLREWNSGSLRLANVFDVKMAAQDVALGRFMFPWSLDNRRLRDAARRVVRAHAERMGLVIA